MSLDDDKNWCRNIFMMMAPNGTWGVPRSGLIFQKTGDRTLTLKTAMPWTDEMAKAAEKGADVPKSRADLIAYQQSDFDVIRDRFKLAGIDVVGKENIK